MQHVAAFPRPQPVPAVPASVPKQNLWILSSWRDLLLYVGTPALLIPLFSFAQMRWSAQDIYIFVGAFGATGHHLPGMIRAYGDRALFERFRWRFIFAPIFLAAVCVSFTWWDMQGLTLVVFFWGVWHGMMQTYGFCRIYDAKTGSFAALTRRLDFATCALWFAAAVLVSPARMTDTLRIYYASGGPYLAPWVLHGGRQIVVLAAIAVALLFLANFFWMWAKGQRPNPVKLALLVTSISFWWFCNNGVTNILAGIALFEVFHDVQYLSIVWLYNRNRVERDNTIGGFMRFVFRRSGSLVGLYIGLVVAYGALGYFKEYVPIDTVKRALTGMVAASGLLHFYYDGFIWKVRERSTRESLGLSGGTSAGTASGFFLPSWLLHGLKWAIAFAVPLGVFCIGQVRGPAPEVERTGWIVSAVPDGARPHLVYATVLRDKGYPEEAAEQFRLSLRFQPKDQGAHFSLATILLGQGKLDEAEKHLDEALRIDPQAGDFHADRGYLLELRGQKGQAAEEYATALRLGPESALVHYNYGMFLWRDGKPKEGAAELQRAIALEPEYADAHYDLGNVLYQQGNLEAAKEQFLAAAKFAPRRARTHTMLGVIYIRQGQTSQAIMSFYQALQLDPSDRLAFENLRRAQAVDATQIQGLRR